MATATLTPTDAHIMPLTQAARAGIESLLAEQCQEWRELLRWDYAGSSRLIGDAIRDRQLEGFVAVVEDEVVGLAFYVVDGHRCSVGDIFISKRRRELGIDGCLADAILQKLDELPWVSRVESQCISVGSDAAIEAFRSRGFRIHLRHYMTAIVQHVRCTRAARNLDDILVRPWRDEDFSRGAFIIHKSYSGESDSLINCQYQSEEGCSELLSILTEHIWCGHFMPRVSQVAVCRKTGKAVGVLLASKIAEASGHIGQISILPGYQGRGLGRFMIGCAMEAYKRRSFQTVSLAVTEANWRARRLYESCGFVAALKFPVFYIDRLH